MSTPDVADIFYVVHGNLVQRTQFAVDIRAERLELVVGTTTFSQRGNVVTQSQERFAVNDFSDDSEGCCERRSVEELLGTNVFIAVYMICLIDIY